MLEETHIHIKTGNRYALVSHFAKVKIDSIWHDAMIYTDDGRMMYCRTREEFDKKFKLIPQNFELQHSSDGKTWAVWYESQGSTPLECSSNIRIWDTENNRSEGYWHCEKGFDSKFVQGIVQVFTDMKTKART